MNEKIMEEQIKTLEELYISVNSNYTDLFCIFCDFAVLLKEKYPDAYNELNALVGTHDLMKKLMEKSNEKYGTAD
jgi:hypothetical protein